MVNQSTLKKLFHAFPKAIINGQIEFVADPNPRVNSYFALGKCETEEDVRVKCLEWLSREACESCHYSVEWRNKEVHEYHLRGINEFCGTSFSATDITVVYEWLGNGIDTELARRFVKSGYKMDVLPGLHMAGGALA